MVAQCLPHRPAIVVGPECAVWYGIPLLSKNVLATSALSAKFTFCGMSAVNRATSAALKFGCNNSDEVTARVEQRAAAVAGLHGRADLKEACVITKPRERAHISESERLALVARSPERG